MCFRDKTGLLKKWLQRNSDRRVTGMILVKRYILQNDKFISSNMVCAENIVCFRFGKS